MNMGKLVRRPFVWCLLAVLFPLAANAVPKIELTAQVTDVTLFDDVVKSIHIAVVEGEPWEVHIDELTEVTVNLANSEGTSVKIEGMLGDGNIVAREIGAGEAGVNEFEGNVTNASTDLDTGDRSIEVLGYWIPVPGDAEIKDASGTALNVSELRGLTVKIEGDTFIGADGGDYFYVNEITEVAYFSCPGKSAHLLEVDKPADDTSKSIEHYCLLKGKRIGLTEISHTDYIGTDGSSHTVGKYGKEGRQGFWLTIDVTGAIIQRCLYNKDKVVDGDETCS
jgi:hypothetical protein